MKTRTKATERMRRRRSERGSALIVSLLVLASVTALGSVAVLSAVQEIRYAGNVRTLHQTAHLSDAGLWWIRWAISRDPGYYFRLVMDCASQSARLTPDGGFSCEDLDERSATVHGDAWLPTDAYGPAPRSATFTVVASDPVVGAPAAGYSQDFCYVFMQFESVGQLSDPNDTGGVDAFDAERRSRMYAKIGPLFIEGCRI